MVSRLRSIALRTHWSMEEVVWRLDHWAGFRAYFKNRARHLYSNRAALAAVTTAASAAYHRTHAHCAWVLSALPRRRVAWYLGRAARRLSPPRGTAPIDQPQLRA